MKAFRAKAVLFDFDGTLSKPGSLDFRVIKKELGCPPESPVLEWILEQPEAERLRAMERLHTFESEGAERSRPNAGAEQIIKDLRAGGLKVGLITRNSLSSVARALDNFEGLSIRHMDVLVTRDDPLAPKPSPEGILHAARKLGVEPRELVVVGDFIFDVEAGSRAGAVTVFLTNGAVGEPPQSDFRIDRLSDLEGVLRLGMEDSD